MRRAPLFAVLALMLLSACGPREIEPELLDYFSADVVRRHDEYKVPHRLNMIVDPVVYLVFIGTLIGFKLDRRLKLSCEEIAGRWGRLLGRSSVLRRVGAVATRMWGDSTWGGALLFSFVYMLLMYALTLPSALYLSWWYERIHGASTETLGHFLGDVAKAALTEAPALAALVFGLFGLSRRRRDWWLLLGVPSAVGILLVGGMLDPLTGQVFVEQEKLGDGPLKQSIVATMQKAGVEYEDVYVEKRAKNTRRTNAAIVGEGPTRRIILWDTLIIAMTPEEISNAVAHELGHLKDRSPGRLFFASVAILPVLWFLSQALRRLGRTGRFGFSDDRDVASLPTLYFICWLGALVTDPVGNAYSRHLERRADQYAFELLREPAAFRSMMVKLARNNLADVHPPAYIRYFFAGHPTTMERIRAAEAFAAQNGLPMPKATPESFVLPEALDPLKQEDKARL